MQGVQVSAGRRLRWLAAFTLLLLVSTAVPVLAEPGEPILTEAADAPQPIESTEPPRLPGADDIRAGVEMAAAAEAERDRWLESPEAVRQREESRYAYADLSVADAQQLLTTVFAEQLAKLNDDPARWLSDGSIVRPLGESGATVRDDEGDTMLLEAGMPVRAENEEGELRKVDLALEPMAGGFEPVNPLAELKIPDEADEPIEIGDRGLAVSAIGADGTQEAHLLGDKNVFYPEAQGPGADLDRIVSPTGGGVEIFDMLRSADSPEVIRYEIEMPAGAQLRSDGNRGAEVAVGDEVLDWIPFPVAFDAQGTQVPVELEIEGDAIALHVSHREGDLAYPILVDPHHILEDWVNYNWFNGGNTYALDIGAWHYTENMGWIEGETHCIYACWGWRGLYVSMHQGNHNPNEYGHWSYSTPNSHSYLVNAWAIPFWRNDHGCSKNEYPRPHDYVGMWNGGGYWNRFLTNEAINVGSVDIQSAGEAFVLGLSTGSGAPIPCWRDLGVGGVAIWLDDSQYPSIDSLAMYGAQNGWFSDQTSASISVTARDAGLGVRLITMFPEGKSLLKHEVGCTGLAGNRCPNTRSWQQNFTAESLGEGKRSVLFSAEDPVGKASGTFEAHTWVDRSKPEVNLDGKLAEATEDDEGEQQGDKDLEKLRLPVYDLKIEAKDGDPGHPHTMRSGVKDIKVFLDGQQQSVPWSPKASCPFTSCSMTQTYQLKLSKLDVAGLHKLKVIAVDFVGKEKVREIEFEYFPATGMKDEYVMHYFPLPDGQGGNEAEEEHPDRPELAVNVMNGNLVYREQDIEVEGPSVDLEVERYYNSMLPEAENTELGEGWTLAQTPDLEPVDTGGSPAPDEAELLESSGVIEEGVELPTETGAESFDPALRATLTKRPGGGYEMTDETGESTTSVVLDETGQTEALLTESYAKVDYAYEGGELSEIAVEDPGSVSAPPEVFEEPEQVAVFSSQFGAPGSDDGEFALPYDLAVASGGDIWVADTANHRIQRFSAEGQYLSQFGKKGSGNGELNNPFGITVDAQGDIWVAEASNNRIQQFSPQGAYLSGFGQAGSGPGQLSLPVRLAIGPDGHIWVADFGNDRVQEFSPQGAYLSQFGGEGSGNGQLQGPGGIAIDADGDIWVAEADGNRVQKFSPEGDFLTKFGEKGSAEGQFEQPTGLGIDPAGNLWVADQGNDRVQRFDPEGEYLGEMGGEGSGEGELQLPSGLGFDPDGDLWVADTGNARMQQWQFSDQVATFSSQFGTPGSDDGELAIPYDLALNSDGDIWVADTANHRIQRFSAEGQYLSQLGKQELKHPHGVAVDPDDYIWVADTANNRVLRFNPEGEVQDVIGQAGSGPGQLSLPVRLAIGPDGHIWVADFGNDRVQEFSPQGQYLSQFGGEGSGNGQLQGPGGIAIDADGDIWVADQGNDRIQEFSPQGQYLSQFGETGSGQGQFDHPTGLHIDPAGGLWVTDLGNNDRVQRFDLQGEYLGEMGEGDFQNPAGLAADKSGRIWIADSVSNQIEQWQIGGGGLAGKAHLAIEDDPKVDVEVTNGLVASIEGEEAGEHSYEHVGNFLVSHDGPQGETVYAKDQAGRLSKVTLANGTWASVAYSADNRVESVTVAPEGANAKTTYFYYQDAPNRRTTVDPPDAPHVTYDIGDDGSVFKWWNTQKPPEIDPAGTLWDFREKPGELWAGNHGLEVQAESTEGIASIQVIANGNQLVDVATCQEDHKTPEIECDIEISEWITHTGNHAPGHLYLEILVTDQSGNSASERFWVDIPEPPPPPAPGTPVAPTFEEVAEFREDYGLEVVFPVKNEIQLNERINNLIGYWHNPHTPLGAVARASWERWGIPLRPEDVAELEYREWYIGLNGPKIQTWGEDHHANIYAGYWVDHRAGGLMRVGFTADQTQNIPSLVQSGQLVATERIAGLSSIPTHPVSELVSLQAAIGVDDATGSLSGLITRAGLDLPRNLVTVGATNQATVLAGLKAHYGGAAPLDVYADPGGSPQSSRFTDEGPVKAGQIIGEYLGTNSQNKKEYMQCTVGPSARERVGTKKNGEPIIAYFVLTAGHCFKEDKNVLRFNDSSKQDTTKIGEQRSRRWQIHQDIQMFEDDGAAVRLDGSSQASSVIVGGGFVEGVDAVRVGETVCVSLGHSNRVACQPAKPAEVMPFYSEVTHSGPFWQIPTMIAGEHGDSGSLVYSRDRQEAVGLYAFGPPMQFTPLLAPPLPEKGPFPYFKPSQSQAPGLLHRSFMGNLSIVQK